MKSTNLNTWHLRYDPQTQHLFDNHKQTEQIPLHKSASRFALKFALAVIILFGTMIALFALNSLTR